MATYNALANVGVYTPIPGYGNIAQPTGLKVMAVNMQINSLPAGSANIKIAIYEATGTYGTSPTTVLDSLPPVAVSATGTIVWDFSRGNTTRPSYSLSPTLGAYVTLNQDQTVGFDSGTEANTYTLTQAYSSFPSNSPGFITVVSPETNLTATIVLGDFQPGPPNTGCGNSTDTTVVFWWQPNYSPTAYNLRYGPTGTNPSTWTVLSNIPGTPGDDTVGDVGFIYTLSPVTPGSSWDWQVAAVYVGYTSAWSGTQTCSATGTGIAPPTGSCGTATTSSVTFDWAPDPANPSPLNYTLQFGPAGTDPSTWTTIAEMISTTYTLSPVPAGSRWSWRVQAVYS